jgi:hypothetical protein
VHVLLQLLHKGIMLVLRPLLRNLLLVLRYCRLPPAVFTGPHALGQSVSWSMLLPLLLLLQHW